MTRTASHLDSQEISLNANYEGPYNRIILVSSDTDLIPAIEKAKEKGKIVEYVGFSHMPSIAMVRHCSESILLKKDDLLPFVGDYKPGGKNRLK